MKTPQYIIISLTIILMASFAISTQAQSLPTITMDKPVKDMSISELQAKIAEILSVIQQLQALIAQLQGGSVSCNFYRNLYPGVSGSDVKCLQQYLNNAGHTVANSGPGSPNQETIYYGSLTRAAVKKWQDANHIEQGAWWGYFGPKSQAIYKELVATIGEQEEPPTPPLSGTYCGDNIAQRPSDQMIIEDCDGTDLRNKTCLTQGYTGGTLLCSNDCSFNTSQCTGTGPEEPTPPTPPTPGLTTSCGDSIMQKPNSEGIYEVCDSTNLGTSTCLTYGYPGGTLSCSSDCITFNTTNCITALGGGGGGAPAPEPEPDPGPVCGNNTDNICPQGCTYFQDTDCTYCGDNILQRPNDEGILEVCDTTKLNNQTCITKGYTGGTLLCSSDCLTFSTTNCTSPTPPANNAPVLNTIGNKTTSENQQLSFTVSATDLDGDVLSYSIQDRPTGAEFNASTRTFTWTPLYTQSGTYQTTFIVSDGSLTDTETITITVSNVNRAPILNSIGDKTVNENEELSFSVSATDADGNNLNFSIQDRPTGATFQDQTFTWTPTYEQQGTYTPTFIVSDTEYTDQEAITITVNDVCVPDTCLTLGYECDTWDDGCGGTLDCSTCSFGYICESGLCVVETPDPYCGDGICDTGETEVSCPQDCTLYNGDSILYLGTTGYAYKPNAEVTDLDYSKDFSVEVITKIEPHASGGRWASFIQKGSRYVLSSGAAYPGFALGTLNGHLEHFGQRITVKVGDGTNHVVLNSSTLEGHVYAVMTWDSTTKELILYINGDKSKNNTNSAINPLNIENNYDLQVGKGPYKTLNRDIFMVRIWNRELSSGEVSNLWNNYDATGQHKLVSGFDSSELYSEWLMDETSDANGGSGITHIKDTAGNNHLELIGGAEIYRGNGLLTMQYPQNGAIDIDKAVFLRVNGGITTLGGNVVKPLHYYFQIDEVNTFDSSDLKESGWIKHYGQYKPILKPNTQYYWRVKVKDSDATPVESVYTSTQSFTTENPTNWYVRPGVYSGVSSATPVPVSGTYGNQDGTSYDDAWNGIREIVWGEDGMEAGDNLYVCGEHVYNTSSNDFLPYQAREYIKESGFSEEYPITIRMDCPGDIGTLYGILMDNRVHVVWNGPDSNDVYWTDDLQYKAGAEFNGTDYVWLDKENNTTWTGHYGATYKTGSINYVKTTDGSDPTGKIYSSSISGYINSIDLGFMFHLGRSKYIKFYKGNFYTSVVDKERRGATDTDIPVSTHIVFDSNKMIYGITYWLYGGHDYWTFRNNDLSYAGNGIYAVMPDTGSDLYGLGASYLLIENNTFKHLGGPNFYHQDAHAIGAQYGGSGHIIQGNYIEDTGSAILFHAYMNPMKDIIIRNNFIKNINVRGAGGHGIVVSGANMESLGRRTGFKIYNNIVMNTGIGKTSSWQGKGIATNNKDPVEIYNNVIINSSGVGIGFGVMDGYPPQGAVYNNIVVNPGGRYLQIIGTSDDWSNFSSDYNLYYPAIDFTADFYFSQAIDRDSNSILADPLFVSADPQEPADFRLQAGSPAIDAGIDVGLTQDYEGNLIPQGLGPDIGAYESGASPARISQTDEKINNLASVLSAIQLAVQDILKRIQELF